MMQLELARQVSYAAGRFGHVMLPENVYEPALQCAEILIGSIGKGETSTPLFCLVLKTVCYVLWNVVLLIGFCLTMCTI